MDKTNVNALDQKIERSFHSIYQDRFSVEQYKFQNYLVLNFSLSFNNLSIQTSWQIGLHEAVPLRTFFFSF